MSQEVCRSAGPKNHSFWASSLDAVDKGLTLAASIKCTNVAQALFDDEAREANTHNLL